ncbi:PREDICTED: eukaryotic translation initiation factor 4E-1A-like [Acropora digitifera]|uniref:eukaryotic translation initiation factor 4E-1A-like n=1 Tax=Acropora digitifera TaxID=70779 RepID=UPI00077A292A|nr:PREDICTED: eukaryotic translation initiation factor 4E-1A-like [Acropora digitifera]
MASGDELPAKDKKEQGKEEEKPQDGQSSDSGALAHVKHPLQNKWALWFYKTDKAKSWKANLRLVTSFDTVEDFWAVYNHIKAASRLQSGCDYSLFKVQSYQLRNYVRT